MILSRAASVLVALLLAGCPAVYPELGTRTRPMAPGRPVDPPPPAELHWIKFVSARVPEKTRDGRTWQANGKASPYAKLLVNGTELLRTTPEADTLAPTWAGSPHGNFKIVPTDRLRVELWDSNAINDKPVGFRELGPAGDIPALDGLIHAHMEEGAGSEGEVVVAYQPAHAVIGIGLWYELRTAGCAITRTLEQSPAERAGIVGGDEVLRLGAREAKTMSPEEIKSAFNAVPLDGLKLTVRHASGTIAELTLVEGPIFPTFSQFGPVD